MHSTDDQALLEKTTKWFQYSRGNEIMLAARELICEFELADTGFFLYQKRLGNDGSSQPVQAYHPWGYFANYPHLEDLLLFEGLEDFVIPIRIWLKLSDSLLFSSIASLPLAYVGIWPITSMDGNKGAIVLGKNSAFIKDEITLIEDARLINMCAYQISNAMNSMFATRKIELANQALQERIQIQSRLEEELRISKDFHHLLSLVRGVTNDENNELSILEQICDLTSHYCGCLTTWIMCPNVEGWFQVLASAGETGFLNEVRFSVRADVPEGKGMAGLTWRTGQPMFNLDIEKDPLWAPWRNLITHYELKRASSLPIWRGPEIWAVLVITYQEITELNEELQNLLKELAESISLGLTRLDLSRKNHELLAVNQTLVSGASAGISIVKYPERVFEEVNHRMVDIFGAQSEADLVNKPTREFYVNQLAYEQVAGLAENVLQNGSGEMRDVPFRKMNGSIVWIDLHGNSGSVAINGVRLVWTFVDVTERHRLEQSLQRSREFLALLSRANEAINQANDEHHLFQFICELAVNNANLSLAWIGQPDDEGWFYYHAVYGATEYLQGTRVSNRAEVPEGNGPAGKAWRTQEPVFFDWTHNIPDLEYWIEHASKFMLRSSAALPIFRRGKVWGIFIVYHAEEEVFDNDLQNILNKLAQDLGFGLDRLDLMMQERKSSHLNNLLLNNLDAGVVVVRYPERIVEQVNHTMLEIYKIPMEDDLLNHSIRIIHPDEESFRQVGESIAGQLQTGAVKFTDILRRRYDDTLIYVDLSGQRLDLGDGVERMIWTHLDVTERHQREQEILILSQQKSLLLDNTLAGINVVQYPERVITEANQRFAELMGFDQPGEVIGMPTVKVYPNEFEHQRMTELSHTVVEQGQGFLNDIIVRNPDGRQRYIDIEGKLLHGDTIHFSILWTTVDVTERHRHLENWMREARMRLNLINHMAIGVFIISPDRAILNVNHRITELFGYEEEEVIGESTRILFDSEEQFLQFGKFYHQLEESKKGMVNLQQIFQKKDGTLFVADVTGAWLDPDEPLQGVIGTIQDISDKLALEREVNEHHEKMKHELELASHLQGAFLPQHLPTIKGIHVTWEYIPSNYLAGDMINVMMIDDSHLAFYILDVMGHGVSAALNAFAINYFIRSSGTNSAENYALNPGKLLTELNTKFSDYYLTESYFTMFYGILNLSMNLLTYAKGGHPSPLLLHNNGEAEFLDQGEIPLGIMVDIHYQNYQVSLLPDDKLLIYSDGLTEMMNEQNEMYSVQRVMDVMMQNKDHTIQQVIKKLLDHLREFSGLSKWNDDVSLIGIETITDEK